MRYIRVNIEDLFDFLSSCLSKKGMHDLRDMLNKRLGDQGENSRSGINEPMFYFLHEAYDKESTPKKKMHLTRAINAIRHAYIDKRGVSLTIAEYMEIPRRDRLCHGLGETSLKTIDEKLKKLGFTV